MADETGHAQGGGNPNSSPPAITAQLAGPNGITSKSPPSGE